MDLQKFYFTYGSDCGQPYCGGWSEVLAPNRSLACTAFRMVHPDNFPGFLNCASVYSASEFEKTRMAGPCGNFGLRCHETITMNLTVTVHGKEVVENESEEADPAAEGSTV